MLQHKLFQVSSRDRDLKTSSSTSDFVIQFNNAEHLQMIKSVVVKQVSFPNVFYNISSLDGNNTFTYAIAGAPTSVTIPEGQYTVTTFIAALDTAAAAIGLTTTHNTLTNKLSFVTTTAIEWLDLEDGNAMAEVLGITAGGGSGIDTLTYSAPGLPSLEGVRNVYIESPQLGESNFLRSNGTLTNILCCVPVTVDHLGINHYSSPHSEIDDVESLSRRHGKNISQVNIRVLDHDGHVLNLQGHHITLILKVYY